MRTDNTTKNEKFAIYSILMTVAVAYVSRSDESVTFDERQSNRFKKKNSICAISAWMTKRLKGNESTVKPVLKKHVYITNHCL